MATAYEVAQTIKINSGRFREPASFGISGSADQKNGFGNLHLCARRGNRQRETIAEIRENGRDCGGGQRAETGFEMAKEFRKRR